MKFVFSGHFVFQRKEQRKISKKLAKSVYLKAKNKYFDTYTRHYVAIAEVIHAKKLKSVMVAYDIIGEEITIVTAYPLRAK